MKKDMTEAGRIAYEDCMLRGRMDGPLEDPVLALELFAAAHRFQKTDLEAAMMGIVACKPRRWVPLDAALVYYVVVKMMSGREPFRDMLLDVLKAGLPENLRERLQLLHRLFPHHPEVVEDVYEDLIKVLVLKFSVNYGSISH